MPFIRKIRKINEDKVADFLEKNKDRSIQEVFDFIKHIPVLKRSTEQHLVYTYIFTHRKELGVK